MDWNQVAFEKSPLLHYLQLHQDLLAPGLAESVPVEHEPAVGPPSGQSQRPNQLKLKAVVAVAVEVWEELDQVEEG